MTKISCCQYPIEKLSDWNNYTNKIESLVFQAKELNSNLLLLPEYAGTEIACANFPTDKELFEALQPLIPKYIEFYKNLSQEHQIYLQPGTIIEKISANIFTNRAYFFSPNGAFEYQDKLHLTEYEKTVHLLQPGKDQKLFDTPIGKIGIAICYDSEFPEVVRGLVGKGATLILVPSYTTTTAGYNRVFLSCRARAIENQCYVAVSFAVNKVDLSAETETTYGQAAIVSPADVGFPDDGIIIQGLINQTQMITGQIDLHKLDSVRKKGQVHNFEDSKPYLLLYQNEIKVVNFN